MPTKIRLVHTVKAYKSDDKLIEIVLIKTAETHLLKEFPETYQVWHELNLRWYSSVFFFKLWDRFMIYLTVILSFQIFFVVNGQPWTNNDMRRLRNNVQWSENGFKKKIFPSECSNLHMLLVLTYQNRILSKLKFCRLWTWMFI